MEEKKSIYHQIKDGDIEPDKMQRRMLNMIPLTERSEEEAREIRRKGQQAMTKKRKEYRTFKETLKELLQDNEVAKMLAKNSESEIYKQFAQDNPDLNVQDLLNLATALNAMNGNMKAVEYARDTMGEKPKDSVEITADIMTEADRALLDKVNKRLHE